MTRQRKDFRPTRASSDMKPKAEDIEREFGCRSKR